MYVYMYIYVCIHVYIYTLKYNWDRIKPTFSHFGVSENGR